MVGVVVVVVEQPRQWALLAQMQALTVLKEAKGAEKQANLIQPRLDWLPEKLWKPETGSCVPDTLLQPCAPPPPLPQACEVEPNVPHASCVELLHVL